MVAAESQAQSCSTCGGELLRGELGLPILGMPRFSYRVKTTTVDTEVDGFMCSRCGAVVLRARHPQRITLAHEALRRAQQGKQR